MRHGFHINCRGIEFLTHLLLRRLEVMTQREGRGFRSRKRTVGEQRDLRRAIESHG